MTLPNFLVIGAPRSGTTSLYEWLQQHPDVFMSPFKEPHFFGCPPGEANQARPPGMEVIAELTEYQALFAGRQDEKAVGEASPFYIARALAPAHIKRLVPEMKLVAILRNPIDRAYSHHAFHCSLGLEPEPDFLKALEAERCGRRDGSPYQWHYLAPGYYARFLKHYALHFAPDRIKVFLFEDLTKEPDRMLADICRFLEIDSAFPFDASVAHNPSYAQKSAAVTELLQQKASWKHVAKRVLSPGFVASVGRSLEQWNRVKPQKLSEEARVLLREEYRADILELQALIGRDLSHWLTPKAASARADQARRILSPAPSLPPRQNLASQPSKSSDG